LGTRREWELARRRPGRPKRPSARLSPPVGAVPGARQELVEYAPGLLVGERSRKPHAIPLGRTGRGRQPTSGAPYGASGHATCPPHARPIDGADPLDRYAPRRTSYARPIDGADRLDRYAPRRTSYARPIDGADRLDRYAPRRTSCARPIDGADRLDRYAPRRAARAPAATARASAATSRAPAASRGAAVRSGRTRSRNLGPVRGARKRTARPALTAIRHGFRPVRRAHDRARSAAGADVTARPRPIRRGCQLPGHAYAPGNRTRRAPLARPVYSPACPVA
jgi:hypothetical protein